MDGMIQQCYTEMCLSEDGICGGMKVGIIGGTGDIGKGMALRLSQNHEVIIGSRKEEKASLSCDACCQCLRELNLPFNLTASTNQGGLLTILTLLCFPFLRKHYRLRLTH